jgi:hypothetical protein
MMRSRKVISLLVGFGALAFASTQVNAAPTSSLVMAVPAKASQTQTVGWRHRYYRHRYHRWYGYRPYYHRHHHRWWRHHHWRRWHRW